MPKNRPTIKDIAADAEVSKTTVSYVLNERRDVAIPEATRSRIFGSARRLGYRRNSLASDFARGRSAVVGVIVSYRGYTGGCEDAFVSRVLCGIEEGCRARAHQMFLSRAAADEKTADEQFYSLLEHKVGGLVFIGIPSAQRMSGYVEEAAKDGVACVVADDRSLAGEVDCVVTDDREGAAGAVQHLLSLGHRRIAHFSSGTSTSTCNDRQAGYISALQEAGLETDESLVIRGSFVSSEAMDSAGRLIGMPDRPTAVFADSDYLAAAVMQAASKGGVRIPDDLALVGYADLQIAEWLGLTTMRQFPEELGRRAADRVFARLAEPQMPPEELVLPVELVIRESCGFRRLYREA